MRIWHYELVRALPDELLMTQWRDLRKIANRIQMYGYPNHILLNEIMNYSHKELLEYSERAINELNYRHIPINAKAYDKFYQIIFANSNKFKDIKPSILGQYRGWHTKDYYWHDYNALRAMDLNEWDEYRIKRNHNFFALKT